MNKTIKICFPVKIFSLCPVEQERTKKQDRNFYIINNLGKTVVHSKGSLRKMDYYLIEATMSCPNSHVRIELDKAKES